MMNKCIHMGRFTKDPELRHTPDGVAVTSFSLAVERDYAAGGGKPETDFFDFIAWRKSAEFICRYFGKGKLAAVESHSQIREWKDTNGANHRTIEFVVDKIHFCGGKKDEQKEPGDAEQATQQAEGFAEIEEDGELPF